MIKVILSDLSRTALFLKEEGDYTLNSLYKQLQEKGEQFNFVDYFYLNTEYLEILKSNSNNFKLYMFTSGKIQNDPWLNPKLLEVFEEVYDPSVVGFEKDESKSYIEISKKLSVEPNEILFIDDDEKFLKVAEEAGLKVHKFINNQNVKEELSNLNNSI